LEEQFWRRVEIFKDNPLDSRLRTHKLSGALGGHWSFSVEYDIRVVFQFAPKNRAIFHDLGTHDEVY